MLDDERKIFAQNFCFKILLCNYISPLYTSMRKGRIWVPDPDPEGPKHTDPDPKHCKKNKTYTFHVKIQLFVTAKFDQEPYPDWFCSLEPDPDPQ
jgi:hypothetical protein